MNNQIDLTALRNSFENDYIKIAYDMMRTKLFVPIGLELNNTVVYFNTNSTFPLKGFTFAYFNPIKNCININIEDPFFVSCTSATERISRLFFVLFHEISHKIFMHSERNNNRIADLWNIACDYEVHNMLYVYADSNDQDEINKNNMKDYLNSCDHIVFKHIGTESPENPKFLFSKDYLDKIAEEIYAMIENSKEESKTQQKFKLSDFLNNSDQASDSNENSKEDSESSSSSSSDDKNPSESNDGSANGESEKPEEESSQDSSGKNENNKNSKNSNKKTANNSNSGSNFSGNLTADDLEVTVTQTTYTLPDGSKVKVNNIEWPENYELPDDLKKSEEKQQREKQNSSTNRSLIENQFAELAKQKGNSSSACSKFLKKLFHIKVDWVKILRNSLQTVLEKSDYFAWSKVRTSSFLLPNMPYLPDIVEDEEKYGTLIISRDESGSMSDQEIAKAGGIIMDAKAFYKKIVLIKHDHEISKIYEFEEITDDIVNVLMNRERCGGTSHKEVFEYLRNYRKTHAGEVISCYIGITDLESDIHEYQNIIPGEIPIIYLAPVSSEGNWTGIKGRVIPVEL